jgi:hypothetical protein
MREWDALLSASQKNNVEEVTRLLKDEGVPPSHGNVVGQTAVSNDCRCQAGYQFYSFQIL